MIETTRGINPVAFFPGEDYQTAPPPRSSRGIHPNEPIIVEQFEELRQELEQLATNDLSSIENALANERTRALSAENDLNGRIDWLASQNIQTIVPCAAMVAELPENTIAPNIPGFIPGAITPEIGRLFVNSKDGKQGYYIYQNNQFVRDPKYTSVSNFMAGQLVSVRTGHVYYYLATSATARSDGGIDADFQFHSEDKRISSANIETGNALIVKETGDEYTIAFVSDQNDIIQTNGVAQFSSKRKTQIDRTEEISTQNTTEINALKRIDQNLIADNIAQQNAIAGNSAAIAIERTSNLNQDTTIEELRLKISNVQSSSNTLFQNLRNDVSQEHQINLSQNAILESLQIKADAATSTNQTQDRLLQALRTDINAENLNNANQNTALQNLQTTVSTNSQAITARLTEKEVRDLWLQLDREANPFYSLINGVAQLWTDDAGRKFTRTNFTVTLPSGNWNWIVRQVDTSGTTRKMLKPVGDSFTGNTYNISFYTDVDATNKNALMPVGDNQVKVHFGRSYAAIM